MSSARPVIVDTCIWSEVLRRRKAPASPHREELGRLIEEGRAVLLGVVRQELLTGIREPERFVELREALRAFPDWPIVARDHEMAAEIANRLRRAGIQGTPTDCLLCAVAWRAGLSIYTVDQDFEYFHRQIKVKLHRPRSGRSSE